MPISDSLPYYSAVAWERRLLTVEGGEIYGLICAPPTGGPYPVVIFRMSGTGNTNGGNITGVVTAAGWTTQAPLARPTVSASVRLGPNAGGYSRPRPTAVSL